MDENTAPAGDNQVQATDVSPDTGTGQGDPGAKQSWLDKLPESLKASKTLAKFTSEEALAKSYVELEAKLGKSFSKPGKDAKPEDWDKYYSKVGRPAKADDYALNADGLEADESFLSDIKAGFHKAGLDPDQAAVVFNLLASKAKAEYEEAANAEKLNQEMIANAWGAKAGEKLELAKRFVLKVGGENALAHLEKTGAGKDAVVLQLLAAAADATTPHRFVDGQAVKGKPNPYAYMNEKR
jgi:hypothetical protein